MRSPVRYAGVMTDEPFYTPGKTVEPDRVAPRRTIETLWTVYKDQHVMTCLIVEAPVGEELRVLVDGEMYLTEVHHVHDGLVGRASTLHRGLLAHGWTGSRPDSR
jgi:hypothetical protein